MLQRQIMFKQLEELQRQKKLQELNDSGQQNVINQQSLIHNKQASRAQYAPLINGTPVRDASQMFMFGNTNLGQGFQNGLPYSQAQNQILHSMGLASQPVDGHNFSRFSHFQGGTRESGGEQVDTISRSFISDQFYQERNNFGPVFSQGLDMGGQTGNDQEQGDWVGNISEKTANINSSQLLVSATMLLISRCDCWLFVLSNRVLCFWWLMKPFLGIPTLLATFSSLETFSCINESSIILVDVLFGILVNIIRMKQSSRTNSSMEELLLSCEMGIDDRSRSNPGVPASFLNLLTFRSINVVMEHGAKKQLDFDDLLQLPIDMDPLFCHDSLLNCWEDQRRHTHSDPSLFWTVCYAYGWPYMCLGLLKMGCPRCLHLSSCEVPKRKCTCYMMHPDA